MVVSKPGPSLFETPCYIVDAPVVPGIKGTLEWEYFSAGGENPESFYRAFSSDVLEAAFNTPKDRLESLFGQQKQGIVIKASEEQIRAISEHTSHSTKQTKAETKGPVNILKDRAIISSRFGQLFVASSERFEQLRDLNTAVAFMNINQGGMILPVYHTKITWLVMVAQGKGLFEMVGSQSQRQGHYQIVRGCLSVGDFLVIPAGHPITATATGDSNLSTVAFGINAHNNKMNFLAGQKSIWRNVDREAKELSFNMPAREVEEILQKQRQSYFVAGPEQRQQQQYVSSILDFVF
ncbi:vicilin Car i 2.0101-like [Lycium ferocissimum]|uniref:vicilin Car i 2.0101-like n=1 Tax=Lycium ferocissimum TaxID=112874 RepID=UPI002814C2EF|nr:vicilin Car i 2.0101-like [Lycium ferocissimum]